MNRYPVDLGLVVGVGIHLALVLTPVVFCVPVLDEFLQIGGVGAVLPMGVTEVAGEAGPREAGAKVLERRIRDRNRKRLFFWHGRELLSEDYRARKIFGEWCDLK